MCCACGGGESSGGSGSPPEPAANCADVADFCPLIDKTWCGPRAYINGLPSLESCPKTCGMCDDPPPCWDECSSACANYAQYCGTEVTMFGKVYDEACPKTCGKC
mmetsp:Transcript_107271/g.346386  ORF Transcript_107271/g.346386 Transcript_107271/m.346386 type:complete len:105 (+) Transcript_107271:2-316(+)